MEVSAVDPVASMMAVGNPRLASIAGEVRDLLKQVISGLSTSPATTAAARP